MRVERVEIRKIFLPYKKPFITSGWTDEGNNGIIVRIYSDGMEGWGEAPVSLNPFYIEETSGTVWSVMKDVLIPLILKADISTPEDINSIFSIVRGNRIAIAGIEFAVWDLAGKVYNKSISNMLGGVRTKINVGVSIGIQEDISSLLSSVENYLDEGYKRIKIKIKPGWDIKPVREIRKRWGDIMLQVDANSAYNLKDSEHLAELDEFNLLLIEQPLGYNDIYKHSVLQKSLRTPICLDESIVSSKIAEDAINMKACKIINVKPSRVGGLTEAKRIHDISEKNEIPVWCGGMLETGIGRAFNTALASLPNFKLPGDISASKRYFSNDIVLNPFELNNDGTLNVPDIPGSGAIVNEEFLEKVTIERLTFPGNRIY